MKTLKLTDAEIKVFSVLLDRAGEAMSMNGCNDFSLTHDGGLTADECVALDGQLRKTFPSDMYERPNREDNIPDFFLLALLEEKIKKLL